MTNGRNGCRIRRSAPACSRKCAPGRSGWESLYWQAGSADKLILIGFKNPALKPLTGKTLAEVAKMRGTSPEDTAIDLVIEDGSRVSTAYFLMNEANVARQVALPWMAFDSDAEAQAPRGVFLKSSVHPRAYGNFARLLGKYVRDEKRVTLPEAVRRLTSFPASNLGIRDRGLLRARNDGRHRHVRRRDDRRHRDLRQAAAICGRHAPRAGQRAGRCCSTAR